MNCPKCNQPYGERQRKKTSHHVVPRKLWVRRELPNSVRQSLEHYTFQLCRGCHDSLNRVLDQAERAVLYEQHQGMYALVLTEFMKGADHEKRMVRVMR